MTIYSACVMTVGKFFLLLAMLLSHVFLDNLYTLFLNKMNFHLFVII